ncbi:hypothetical protein PRUPE_5G226300 [Prunus persica]|uniref:Phytocyanin domain-containing protein n=1 Tax=Prunus persica TaxID=3760 RepID=A0A251PCE9_PRUPE|nr:mavicyanin [Prunus persica]ONI09244.1 hypothetical protein PRUPE_5G226300 [Prunus persica]
MEYSSKVFVLLFLGIQVVLVTCIQFEVGDKTYGWEVPKTEYYQQLVYNEWASKKRFNVDDTLYFGYDAFADSVLVVSKEDYEKCHSDRPIYYSNDGHTVVTLDRPGLFYFMSGVAEHCEKGQKMVVKVLEPAGVETPPADADQSENQNSSESLPQHKNNNNNTTGALAAISSTTIIFCIMTSLLGLFFF